MIKQNEIIEHIKTLVEAFLQNNIELSQLSRGYHTELYYVNEEYHDIDITLLSLSGDISTEVIQYPIQMMVDVKASISQEIMNVLQALAVSNNEQITEINGVTVRQYFRTPTMVNKFVKSGFEEYVTITLDCSLFEFENLFDIEELKIDSEEIKFVTFAMVYGAATNSVNGISVNNNPGQVRTTVGSAATTYTITAIPKQTRFFNKVLNQMYSCLNQNQAYTLKFKVPIYKSKTVNSTTFESNINKLYVMNSNFGYTKVLAGDTYNSSYLYFERDTIEKSCVLVGSNFTKELQGFPILQLSFMEGE